MLTPSQIAEMAENIYPKRMNMTDKVAEFFNEKPIDDNEELRTVYIAAFTDAMELMSKEVEQAFIEYEQTTSSPLDVSLDELLAKVKSKFLPEPPKL